MVRTRQVLVPNIDVIVNINRDFIAASGEEYVGSDNLLNRLASEYVLQAVNDRPFGVNAYSGIPRKAALIAERIILNHVFWGANKRTALMTAAVFLELNGWRMAINDGLRFDEEAISMAMRLQEKEIDGQAFARWISCRSSLIPR